jgi:hypothetical protein
MILLYPSLSKWEYSYIKNDILYNISKNNKLQIVIYNNLEELLNYNFKENKLIFIFSTNMINQLTNYNLLCELINKLQPSIIISLSDEFGNNDYVNQLTKNTNLYLHCYNHSNYIYNKNSFQIPLGYINNYFGENNSFIDIKKNINKIINRNYDCSFVGEIKSDRKNMIQIFKNSNLQNNIINTKNSWNELEQLVKPEELFNIYNNSIFVLIGRGNKSLDCFRIYEAITAGAIPLLVGEENEINNTFNFNNYKPFLLYDSTWELLLQKCIILLNNKIILQDIQNFNIEWYINKLNNINNLLEKAII